MIRRKTADPRAMLKTATANLQRHYYARYHSSADLEPYIEHYWSVAWDLRGRAPERTETLPHPSVHMTFERNVGGRIIGVARGKFSRQLEGQSGVLAAKFTPGGFYPFVRVPISTFADATKRVGDVFGARGNDLVHAVLAETEDAPRIAIVEEFLRECQPAADGAAALMTEMVYAVSRDRGILRVDDLVERYRMNMRTLQRLFAKYVGTSPKWVIQRYRLLEAAERLNIDPLVAQSALATDLGYADQAHFIRDFKALVGTSPAAYARIARDVCRDG